MNQLIYQWFDIINIQLHSHNEKNDWLYFLKVLWSSFISCDWIFVHLKG